MTVIVLAFVICAILLTISAAIELRQPLDKIELGLTTAGNLRILAIVVISYLIAIPLEPYVSQYLKYTNFIHH